MKFNLSSSLLEIVKWTYFQTLKPRVELFAKIFDLSFFAQGTGA